MRLHIKKTYMALLAGGLLVGTQAGVKDYKAFTDTADAAHNVQLQVLQNAASDSASKITAYDYFLNNPNRWYLDSLGKYVLAEQNFDVLNYGTFAINGVRSPRGLVYLLQCLERYKNTPEQNRFIMGSLRDYVKIMTESVYAFDRDSAFNVALRYLNIDNELDVNVRGWALAALANGVFNTEHDLIDKIKALKEIDPELVSAYDFFIPQIEARNPITLLKNELPQKIDHAELTIAAKNAGPEYTTAIQALAIKNLGIDSVFTTEEDRAALALLDTMRQQTTIDTTVLAATGYSYPIISSRCGITGAHNRPIRAQVSGTAAFLTTTFNVLTGKSISVPGPSEVRLYDAGGRLVCRDLQAVRGAWRPSIAVPAGRYVVQVIPANGRSIPQSR